MTQKEYNQRLSMMEICRVFADQMSRCMDNAGLTKAGYKLTIEVGNEEYGTDGLLLSTVTLEENISDVGSEQWNRTQMCQMKLDGKGWFVHADPLAESGTVPPTINGKAKAGKNPVEGSGKNGTKPYPPDGMWFSTYDDHSALGGG